MERVDIVLATFNGARFLPEQLQSIEAQTHREWRLIVRDDGSADATRAILEGFRGRHPDAFEWVVDADRRLGPRASFGRLLERSTASHVLLCDQDDVWRADKIERLLATAKAHERPGVPLLVHSDLEVVDAGMRTLAPSFWRYQHIDPAKCHWSRLLLHNVATGSACLVNDALRSAATPIPAEAIMHDWWLALVAATTGEIHCVPEPTVRYRQHGGNDTGAKRWGPGLLLRQARRLGVRGGRDRMRAYQRQALALSQLGSPRMGADVREVLHEFGHLDAKAYPSRVRFLLRHRILKNGWLRNAAVLALA